MEDNVYLITGIYLVGAVITFVWCVKNDLKEGAAIFCALFSWIALIFICLGELAWYTNKKEEAKEAKIALIKTKEAFNKVFNEKGTSARVNINKGVIEVSREHFKLKPYQKDFLAEHEILHFEHHRKRKHLRRKITGKRVQEFINYLSDCESTNIKEYAQFLKRDFKLKLWWYNLFH